MNTAEEDYIKLIYEFENESDDVFIKNADLAEKLGYTVQSVNEMIKRLNKKKLVNYQPYKGVNLTKKGKSEAIRMIRAHRIWEVFLSEKLGLSWEKLHEEAEKLEHATSQDVLWSLYAFLGKPKYCNHGNPIPNEDNTLAPTYNESLYSFDVSTKFIVKRVIDHKPLLRHLNTINLQLNDVLEIIEKDDFAQIIKIKLNHEIHSISKNIAEMIFGLSKT